VSGHLRSLLITSDAVGGVWTFSVELCRALAARGVRTTLAVMGPPPSAARRAEVRSIPGLSLAELPCRLEWMDDPWRDVDASAAWLLALEREARPDVVHLNGYAHGCVPFFAPVVVAGHSCVLSWFEQVKGVSAPAAYDEYRRRVTRGIRCASLVVAPSASMLCSLRRLYGPLPGARVIHNGASRAAPGTEARKEPFALAAGRMWDEAKNLGALDAIAASLEWPVLVAGERRRPDGGEVEARSVRLLGQIERAELLALLARASIFAAPALYEPFGLAVLEAAFAGCALVLADIPTFRELWEGCADLVDPRDPAALASGLRRLIGDPLRRATLASRARSRAERFQASSMADHWLAAYRGVLREPRGAAA